MTANNERTMNYCFRRSEAVGKTRSGAQLDVPLTQPGERDLGSWEPSLAPRGGRLGSIRCGRASREALARGPDLEQVVDGVLEAPLGLAGGQSPSPEPPHTPLP